MAEAPQEMDPTAYGEGGENEEFVILNDDVLTSVSNATLVLVDGSDLERMAVLFQFPQFLEHCPDESLQIMVPQICEGIVAWPSNVQMAAAEALYFVVNMKAPEAVARKIVVASLRVIAASESGDVFDACGEILSMMLPQVPRAEVLELVVPATIERAGCEAPESRRLAARIIGSLNDSLNADEIQSLFLEHALTLADDEDESVRAMIAQAMASVGVKLPLRVVEDYLWPKLTSLMKDDNARVRAAAMRAIARAAEAHRKQYKSSSAYSELLLPMFMEECQRSAEVAASDLRTVDDDTYLMLEIFSEVYGYFLCAVSPLFPDEATWTTALNTLRRMVTCNGPTVRHWCSFNVPAIALICAKQRTEKITGVIQALSVDSDVETRATLAAGLVETVRLLGSGPLRAEVIGALGDLLTDENPQVRMNTLEHFSDYMQVLSTYNCQKIAGGLVVGAPFANEASNPLQSSVENDKMHSQATPPNFGDPNRQTEADKEKFRQLSPIFSSLELMTSDSWRTQRLLAVELKKSAHLVPQEVLCEHVAPLLFQMARESTYLVRQSSMQALMHVLRYIPDVRRRNHILKHFRLEWARGKVYWTRLAYIDGTQCALSMFSSKLFSTLFKDEILNMTKDPVPNVRHRLVRLFSSLAPMWKDRPEFREALNVLAQDPDVHVAQDAKKFLANLDYVAPPSPMQIAEDEKKRAQEEAFYVHKKKPKKQTRSKASTGANGIAPPSTAQPVLPNGGSASHHGNSEQRGREPSAATDVANSRPRTGNVQLMEELPGRSSVNEKKDSKRRTARRASSEITRPVHQSPPSKKSFCGCFGG